MSLFPFNKGFEQMRSVLEELAYMNDDGTLYLLLEDTVYKIDVLWAKRMRKSGII